MITTSGLLKAFGTVATIGSVGWVFDIPNEVREYVSEPLRIEIQELDRKQSAIIASAKHWDLTTDRLSEDVRRLEIKIRSYKNYLDEYFQQPVLTSEQQRNKLFCYSPNLSR